MAIADKPILEPNPLKPGVPLRRSTLIVMLVLLLVMGLVSSLLMSGASSAPSAPPSAQETPVRHVGTAGALTEEEEAAGRAAERAAREARRAATAPRPPASAPASPLPANIRRADSATGLLDHAGRRGDESGEADLALEAQARRAKSVVFDQSEAGLADAVARGARSAVAQVGAGVVNVTDAPGRKPAQERTEGAVADRIEAFREQMAGQGKPQSPSHTGWLREYAAEKSASAKVMTGYQAPQRLVLRQGKVIPAVLGRKIVSDLPGRITAYVSTDVYDRDGALLIPMGASLVGQYDSQVKVGQSRVMFAFERLILPNGYSFDLPAAAGADLAGAAGMTGDVNNHFFQMFGTSLLIALLGDQLKQPEQVTVQGGGAGPVTAAGQVLVDVSKSILDRNRVIAPTITVEQGTRINVEVVGDMVFPESYRAK